MAKQKFVFNVTDRKRLGGFGVTSPQLVTLQRKLPVIAELLESRTPLADVRDVLLEARRHARLLVRIATDPRHRPPQCSHDLAQGFSEPVSKATKAWTK